jgi:probable HAF family extracellular repeat protein
MSGHRLFQPPPVMVAVLLAFPFGGCAEDSSPTVLGADALHDVQAQDTQIQYEAVILTPDYARSLVRGINRHGAVSGMGHPDPPNEGGPQHIFIWDDEFVEGPEAWAGGIDDDGNVVGSMQGQAVLWPTVPESGFTNEVGLHTTGMGEGGKGAWGINNNGNIVGTGPAQDGDYHNWFWPDKDEPPIRLSPPEGFDNVHWTGRLNDAGYVISHASGRDADGRWIEEALVWRANDGADGDTEVSPVTLPHLESGVSAARGINAEGDVVGGSRTSSGETRAVLWRYENGWGDPIPLSGDPAEAWDLTDRVDGVVRIVGRTFSGNRARAAVWTVDGSNNVQMQLLPLPEKFHTQSKSGAELINEAGWIAGYAQDRNAHQLAVLWRPLGHEVKPPPDDDDDEDSDDGDADELCHRNPRHPCHDG